jgi:hypothetical protein
MVAFGGRKKLTEKFEKCRSFFLMETGRKSTLNFFWFFLYVYLLLRFFRTDFWIDYIQLELTYPGGDALKSSKMVWKAQRTLKPEAVALFMSMYNLIMLDDNST